MFDCVVMNPPYDNGLHEKFLEKAFDISNQYIVSVEPATWLLGKRQKKNITDKMDQYHAEITTIDGNKYFDAAIGGTMSVNFIDKNGRKGIIFDGKQYERCDQISLTSNDDLLEEFKAIVKPLYERDNLQNHIKYTPEKCKIAHLPFKPKYIENNPNMEWWCIKIPIITKMGIILSDSIIKSIKQYKDYNNLIDLGVYIPFDNKLILNNFINYCKTDFARICLLPFQHNLHLADNDVLTKVPYFDFSDPMFRGTPAQIDERLFKKYNVSPDIINRIHEVLPDYYNIRK